MSLLAEEYHVVLFDNASWGLNTRDGDSPSCKRGSKEAEQWLIDFVTRTMEAINDHLPEKFILGAHSFGAYIVSLYASIHPERVSALCLISPVA